MNSNWNVCMWKCMQGMDFRHLSNASNGTNSTGSISVHKHTHTNTKRENETIQMNGKNKKMKTNGENKKKKKFCLLERLHQWQVKYLCMCWFKYLKSFFDRNTFYAKSFQNDLAFLLATFFHVQCAVCSAYFFCLGFESVPLFSVPCIGWIYQIKLIASS